MRCEIYCSSFCNYGHRVKTGRPIGHECRIIPPKALKAEMAGNNRKAIDILRATPEVIVKGRDES